MNTMSDDDADAFLKDQTKMFLWNAALTYHKSSPTLSRLLMSRFLNGCDYKKIFKDRVQRSMCFRCGSLWMPGNHTIKLNAKSKVPKKINRLLQIEAECSWKLGSIEKNCLKSVKERSSNLIYHCLSCHNSTKVPLPSIDGTRFTYTPKESCKKKKKKEFQDIPVADWSHKQLKAQSKEQTSMHHKSNLKKKSHMEVQSIPSKLLMLQRTSNTDQESRTAQAKKLDKKKVSRLGALLKDSFDSRLQMLLTGV